MKLSEPLFVPAAGPGIVPTSPEERIIPLSILRSLGIKGFWFVYVNVPEKSVGQLKVAFDIVTPGPASFWAKNVALAEEFTAIWLCKDEFTRQNIVNMYKINLFIG